MERIVNLHIEKLSEGFYLAIGENEHLCREGCYMGQETGTAAADIIFGEVNPSGKMTMTFPKSASQLPMYYNYKPSARYLDYISQDADLEMTKLTVK